MLRLPPAKISELKEKMKKPIARQMNNFLIKL
jgi:hypothetical protein